MKKILILVFSNLKHDARVMRQINFLKSKYALTVCCYDISPTEEHKTIILASNKLTFFRKAISAILLLLKQFTWAYHTLYPYKNTLKAALKNDHFDIIIANDIEALPLAFDLKDPETKILFDAHEYAPRHFEDKLWWRVFFQDFNNFLCRKYIPRVQGMITIGQTIAEEYEKHFGVKPVVITNACRYYDVKPVETNAEIIKLVHHGIVNRSRRIELIIGMMDHLPDHFTLDLILVIPTLSSQQTRQYYEELKNIASSNKRVHFKDPVSIENIIPLLQQYDMGIILAPPINFNYSNGLPNKLFDFIQARIGVVTGPTPEIARIVSGFNIGVVADDFTSAGLAKKLIDLDRTKIQAFKHQSDKTAKEFNAEKNEVIVNELVDSMLTK
jgi:hypothetical protein